MSSNPNRLSNAYQKTKTVVDHRRTSNLVTTQSPSLLPEKNHNQSEQIQPQTSSASIAQAIGNVKVVCRFRPLNDREKNEAGTNLCVKFLDEKTCTVNHTDTETGAFGPVRYNFDRIFDPSASQEQVYTDAVKPIIDCVLEGFNGTILAYGQTSSGKTFTMQGPDIENPQLCGIIPRMVKTVFDQIENSSEDIEFTVKVSMIEIYMEKIKDLLDPKKTNLKIHEDKVKGIYIEDVTENYVGEEQEVYEIMKQGNDNRAIGVTDMNAQSSRSHSCFILTISQNNNSDFSQKTGKLFLVDLAGSEKISKTGAKGQTLDEAKTINKSLTALGLVITALTDGKSQHVPYRDSKLTRILSESLGGNSKTCLIITCSPSIFNDAETISTLKFGKRAKQIKNKAKINKEVSLQELKLLLDKTEKDCSDKERRIVIFERILIFLGHIEKGGLKEQEVKDLEKRIKELGGKVPVKIEKAEPEIIYIYKDLREQPGYEEKQKEKQIDEQQEVSNSEKQQNQTESDREVNSQSPTKTTNEEIQLVQTPSKLDAQLEEVEQKMKELEKKQTDLQDQLNEQQTQQLEQLQQQKQQLLLQLQQHKLSQQVDSSNNQNQSLNENASSTQENNKGTNNFQNQSFKNQEEEKEIKQEEQQQLQQESLEQKFSTIQETVEEHQQSESSSSEEEDDDSLEDEMDDEDLDDILDFDANGEIIVFRNQNEINIPENITPSSSVSSATNLTSTPQSQVSSLFAQLDPLFEKKKEKHKIILLLAALKKEKYKVEELTIKMNILKQQFQAKIQLIQQLKLESQSQILQLKKENTELIEQVAKIQIVSEQQEEMIKNQEMELGNLKEETASFKEQMKLMNQEQAVQKQDLYNQIMSQKDFEVSQQVREILKKEKMIFEQEKAIIMKDQKQRKDRIKQLEEQLLKSEQEKAKLESGLNIEEKQMRQKFSNYEKNLEQLTLMYHQLASQKNVMSKDMNILEKKLQKKTEKIKEYDNSLKVTRQQVAQMQSQMRELRSMIEKNKGTELNSSLLSQQLKNEQDFDKYVLEQKLSRFGSVANGQFMYGGNHHYQQKIVKMIKGGGGNKRSMAQMNRADLFGINSQGKQQMGNMEVEINGQNKQQILSRDFAYKQI